MTTTPHCKDTGTLEPASSLLSTLTIAGVRAKAHAKAAAHTSGALSRAVPTPVSYGPPHSQGSGKHSIKHRNRLAGWGGSRGARTKARLRETLSRLGTPRQRGSLAGCAGNAGG